MKIGASTQQVAEDHCRIHGHNLVSYPNFPDLICSKCGLDVDEIRAGETKGRPIAAD